MTHAERQELERLRQTEHFYRGVGIIYNAVLNEVAGMIERRSTAQDRALTLMAATFEVFPRLGQQVGEDYHLEVRLLCLERLEAAGQLTNAESKELEDLRGGTHD